ncbi:hypothetical protein EWM64_g1777 [Hericium alpestre]|uniref:Uncharacterized protein n=1 Tax=Hericium alpestre TaxID=135208 RepID=A0A4Z0A599_9AGAM|nr:hypothetical protein EWM64_g1777 [Hericium alpestre]
MLRHHTSLLSYLIEARKESVSNHVPRPLIESTPKARAERYQLYASRRNEHEPMDQLPPSYLVYAQKPRGNVPLFHFGIGATMKQLHNYAVQHRLVPEKYYNDAFYSGEIIEAAVKHLDRISGVNLYLEGVQHPKYSWVVARYSNYTWYHEEVNAREENKVIDLIRRELKIEDIPQWHFSVV